MKLHHIALVVEDLERSKDFYYHIFGFEVVEVNYRKDLWASKAFLKLEDFMLELWEFDNKKQRNDSLNDMQIKWIHHFALQVNDLTEVINQLKSKWIYYTLPKLWASWKYYSFVNDPDWIPIELYEDST